MSTRALYNQWSATYDAVENKTRDLEKVAAQATLSALKPEIIIELGCGTGKNTAWLAGKCIHLIAVDLSEDMMAKAREKISQPNVEFHQADITRPWKFTAGKADLITCSLILEHIESLLPVFQQVETHLRNGGYFYVCELHPFKQYNGSKARFETAEGLKILPCYTHHLSDYLNAAACVGLRLVKLEEWFDDNDRSSIPRLASFLFHKLNG